MNLFSEIYNSYYHITTELLSSNKGLTINEIYNIINELGYSESLLYLIPKLTEEGGWQLLSKEDYNNNGINNGIHQSSGIYSGNGKNKNDMYYSVLKNKFSLPMSVLQKRWLKTLLNDERILLFLKDSEIKRWQECLKEVEPLFRQSDFYYYDRFEDGDDFSDPIYRQKFRTILKAIQNHEYLVIEFQSHTAKRIHHWFYPAKLEYSIKNNVFRLYALETRNRSRYRFFTINVSRIVNVKPTRHYPETLPDIDEYIVNSYYHEPVTVLIKNERNALERAMLQFANYKKNTTYLHDDLYQCDIYYNRANETELLIEILSYGPLMKVVGNEDFLKLMKERLKRQKELRNSS